MKSGQVQSGPVRSGQVKSGQVRSSQVKSGQVRSGQVKSGQVRLGEVKSGQVRSSQVRLGHPFSLVSGARSAEKILLFATLDQVTRFLWESARRKCCEEKNLLLQSWRAQRGEKFCNVRLGNLFSLVSGNT